MTTVYVVHGTASGYAREDPLVSSVAGVYTTREIAQKVAIVTHGTISAVTLDEVSAGLLQTMNILEIQ